MITVNFLPLLFPVQQKKSVLFLRHVSLTRFLSYRPCFDFLCFRCLQPRGTEYESFVVSNMAVVAKLSVNGCAEIENLLAFCKIPTERICVEEEKEFESKKV